jgi:hypothetical protein
MPVCGVRLTFSLPLSELQTASLAPPPPPTPTTAAQRPEEVATRPLTTSPLALF